MDMVTPELAPELAPDYCLGDPDLILDCIMDMAWVITWLTWMHLVDLTWVSAREYLQFQHVK